MCAAVLEGEGGGEGQQRVAEKKGQKNKLVSASQRRGFPERPDTSRKVAREWRNRCIAVRRKREACAAKRTVVRFRWYPSK
jgi:hypothetical protein